MSATMKIASLEVWAAGRSWLWTVSCSEHHVSHHFLTHELACVYAAAHWRNHHGGAS